MLFKLAAYTIGNRNAEAVSHMSVINNLVRGIVSSEVRSGKRIARKRSKLIATTVRIDAAIQVKVIDF